MSFSVDQFMQVKCTFQLTSESDSSESIHTNREQIRLCTSINLDNNNSALIVMVCTNETGNNHILAYYIERRAHRQLQHKQNSQQQASWSAQKSSIFASTSIEQSQSVVDGGGSTGAGADSSSKSGKPNGAVTFADLAAQSKDPANSLSNDEPDVHPATSNKTKRAKSKPRIIVKQIYYHDYNEDIVAICLNKLGTKLVLVNASSTVYVIPIKNILLNLHAQKLRSSQGRSMYFYDASIIYCNQSSSFVDPVDVAYYSPAISHKSTVILASLNGKIAFLSVEEKRVVSSTSVGEPIKSIKIVHDKHGHSLLITCKSLNQYRLTLEYHDMPSANKLAPDKSTTKQSIISLPTAPPSRQRIPWGHQKPAAGAGTKIDENARQTHRPWSAKPVPIRPLSNSGGGGQSGATALAANALQRVLLPSSGRFGSQTSLIASFNNEVRERPLSLLGQQELTNLISLVDVLGPNKSGGGGYAQAANRVGGDLRLLRFYSDKHYSLHGTQRPQVVCKLDSLDPDELITHLILTDRFIALTTDRDRCIVQSRNCSKLKKPIASTQLADLSPLIKEITFNHEEKIILLLKSPALNDSDNIIDSFLLVTSRSIYSIEARHGCRELFINLIDSHLAIKRTLFMSKPRSDQLSGNGNSTPFTLGRMITSASEDHLTLESNSRLRSSSTASNNNNNNGYETSRSAESNLLINSFLQHRDAYERVCHDSLAFSTLFKVELASLYEAYADRLLQRGQLELANRFFQMASFDHVKILGKYIRIGAYKETIEYVKALLDEETDFRRVLGESERIELSKIAFECLLAKTIVERSKLLLFNKAKPSRSLRQRLLKELQPLKRNRKQQQQQQQPPTTWINLSTAQNIFDLNPFSLCEHSPRGQDAKLSATTITPFNSCAGGGGGGDGDGDGDEEDTLTGNPPADVGREDIILQWMNVGKAKRSTQQEDKAGEGRDRLECEKSLLDFMKNLMPSSMFEYVIDQLLDFDLIEFINLIAQSDVQILSFIKMVIRYRDEDRLVFRAGSGGFEPLLNRLTRLNQAANLIKVSIEKEEFLEFLTSRRVTRALVTDIGLTCEYYGYQHSTLVQFRKYSFAAAHHLETYKRLVKLQRERSRERTIAQASPLPPPPPPPQPKTEDTHHIRAYDDDDDSANDGLNFSKKFEEKLKMVEGDKLLPTFCFNQQQKQHVEMIFIEFLNACLDESTEDSCRLWDSYVDFYLTHVGSLQDLQADISRMIEDIGDCRISVSLYRAIHRDQLSSEAAVSGGIKHRNKANLFENEFLMRLLSKTLAIQNAR